MAKIFSRIQDYQDALLQRFCNPRRRVISHTDWFDDDTPFAVPEQACLADILFYEARGYYLFQEPEIEHQPVKKRFRIILTFKPTESNV